MNDWKVVPKEGPSPEFEAYRKDMTAAFLSMPRQKPKVSTIQAASTQRVLSMTDAELEEYRNRPLPTVEQAMAEDVETAMAKTVERVGLRNIEILKAHGNRNELGKSELSSVSEERKELGRQAFTCTPPTPLTEEQKQRLTKIEPIKQLKEYEWKDLTKWQAFKHWLKGGIIRRG